MNYQITCTCGHVFQLSDEQIKVPVKCPACAKPLSVVIQAPTAVAAGDGTPPLSPTAAESTKRCPFCGEVILAIARKCKHCGEFLDRAQPSDAGAAGSFPAVGAGTGTGGESKSTGATPDEPVFSLTTSQWDNFWRFVTLFTSVVVISVVSLWIDQKRVYAPIIILASIVFAGFIAWFFYLHAKNTRIFIRPARIDVEKGILSRSLDSLELFRINDTELKQNLIERVVGIGTIKLMTADSSSEPELVLFQVPQAREVLKYLQTQIPIAARQRGAVYMEK